MGVCGTNIWDSRFTTYNDWHIMTLSSYCQSGFSNSIPERLRILQCYPALEQKARTNDVEYQLTSYTQHGGNFQTFQNMMVCNDFLHPLKTLHMYFRSQSLY